MAARWGTDNPDASLAAFSGLTYRSNVNMFTDVKNDGVCPSLLQAAAASQEALAVRSVRVNTDSSASGQATSRATSLSSVSSMGSPVANAGNPYALFALRPEPKTLARFSTGVSVHPLQSSAKVRLRRSLGSLVGMAPTHAPPFAAAEPNRKPLGRFSQCRSGLNPAHLVRTLTHPRCPSPIEGKGFACKKLQEVQPYCEVVSAKPGLTPRCRI